MMSDSSSEISLDKQIKTDEHVRHVTIRQIIGAERKHDSAPWIIERREVSAVMIVANILDCTQNKDGVLDFHLDDGTGRIKGSMRSMVLSFNHFAYVRVVGTISQPRSREVKYFNATGLAEVVNPHEIFYHCVKAIQHSLLIKMSIDHQENTQEMPSTKKDIRQGDVLYHHERTEKSGPKTLIREIPDDPRGFKREPFATPGYHELERHEEPCSSFSHEGTLSSDTSASSYHTAYSRRSASPESQSGYDQEMELETPADGSCFPSPTRQRSCARIRDPYQNLSNLHRDIILSISNGLEDMAIMYSHFDLRDGVHIDLIVSGLKRTYGNHLNQRQVGDAIEELIDEGYIFTTIDDLHYNVN